MAFTKLSEFVKDQICQKASPSTSKVQEMNKGDISTLNQIVLRNSKTFAGNPSLIGTFSLLTDYFFSNTLCTAVAPAPSLFCSFAAEAFPDGSTLDSSAEPAPQPPPAAPTADHTLQHVAPSPIKHACARVEIRSKAPTSTTRVFHAGNFQKLRLPVALPRQLPGQTNSLIFGLGRNDSKPSRD